MRPWPQRPWPRHARLSTWLTPGLLQLRTEYQNKIDAVQSGLSGDVEALQASKEAARASLGSPEEREGGRKRLELLKEKQAGQNGSDGAPSTVPGPPGNDSTVPGPPGNDSTVPGPAGADAAMQTVTVRGESQTASGITEVDVGEATGTLASNNWTWLFSPTTYVAGGNILLTHIGKGRRR